MNEVHQWLEIGVAIVVVVGFIIKINQDRDSVLKTIEHNISVAKEEGDAKRTRIYERLDESKKTHNSEMATLRQEIKDNFVDIRLCKVVHDNTDRIFTEIKNEITEVKKSLDRLYDKLSHTNDNAR